jgi:antirestriction protein
MSCIPQVYVACLSAYNNGKLHGKWIEMAQSMDDIQKEIDDMLANSPEEDAEEWAIHDYEGFGNYKVSEYEDLKELAELAELIENHDEVALVATEIECHIDDIINLVEERYCGEYASKEDWADQYLNDTGVLSDLPETMKWYFDYEKYARDCELNGDVIFVEMGYNSVHVFYGH